MPKLKDVVKDLKVGDVVWIRTEILGIGDQNVGVGGRHFDLSALVMSSLLGAPVYGDPEVFLGELPGGKQE